MTATVTDGHRCAGPVTRTADEIPVDLSMAPHETVDGQAEGKV